LLDRHNRDCERLSPVRSASHAAPDPPRKRISRFEPERVLVGRGQAIEAGADAALREALAGPRRDLPRLLLSIPNLLRGA
jgi:hypothetical protein